MKSAAHTFDTLSAHQNKMSVCCVCLRAEQKIDVLTTTLQKSSQGTEKGRNKRMNTKKGHRIRR